MRNLRKWLLFAFTVIIFGISSANIFVLNNKDFWDISIAQVLTLLVATLFAFWATQRENDLRKVKEQMQKIVEKIQMEVSASDFVSFDTAANPDEVQKRITVSTRKLNNCITVLKYYSQIIDISEGLNYIDKEVKNYRDFVSDKVGDLDYLQKSEIQLIKYAENINSKCDYIVVELYKK